MKTTNVILLFIVLFSSSVFAVTKNEKQALIDLYQSTNGAKWKTSWNLNEPVETWKGVTIKEDKIIGLDLAANQLDGSLSKSLKDLKFLESLNLKQNKLVGAIPAELFSIKSLKNLNLSFNQLTGNLPSEIGFATQLKSVEIFMNQLSGNLPSSIGKLKQLEILSLFNNDFVGELPATIFELTNLKELLLSSNRLNGELNESIHKLVKLQNLSLFDNQLKGTIPSLKPLKDLKILNLSLNNFSDYDNASLVSLDKFNLRMYKNNTLEKVNIGTENTIAIHKEVLSESNIVVAKK